MRPRRVKCDSRSPSDATSNPRSGMPRRSPHPGSAVPARADLIVSIGSTSVAQGGTGTLDVYLSSTATPSSPDRSTITHSPFRSRPTPWGTSRFPAARASAISTAATTCSSVTARITSLASLHPPRSEARPRDHGLRQRHLSRLRQYERFHARSSLSSSSGQILLATLALDASITSAGESFTVSLVPTSGNGSSSSGSGTYFNVVDSSFNELSAVPFTSTSGTVNIVSAASPRAVLDRLRPDRVDGTQGPSDASVFSATHDTLKSRQRAPSAPSRRPDSGSSGSKSHPEQVRTIGAG